MSLKCFFEPTNIAVIGASNDPAKSGYQIFKNLLDLGFSGKILPVNPKLDELFGHKCYASLADIPGTVDLMIVSIPAFGVPDIFEAAEKRGDIKAAVVIASGFSETKIPERVELENRMLEIAHRAKIRVMGPNCVGVMNTANHLDTTFAANIKQNPGGMSVISQSGALGASIMMFATNQPAPMGFAKWAHVGNQTDVDVLEIMRYYKDDPETKVIAIYMEGLRNAREFIELATEVNKTKPIIILKVGRSEAGSGAAASHTGSLVGADAVYDAAFRQAGILRANTLEELLDTAKLISMQPMPKGNKVMVLTEAGGPGIIAMDELGLSEIAVNPDLGKDTIEKLREILPPMAIVDQTPGYVDMSAAADEKHHADSVKVSMADPAVDGLVHISVPPTFLQPIEMARQTAEALKGASKPIAICYMAGDWITPGRKLLEQASIPTFDMPERAARAMANMCKRQQLLDSLQKQDEPVQQITLSSESRAAVSACKKEKRNVTEPEARSILADAGVYFEKSFLAKTADEAATFIEKIGKPAVMKIVSPQILHKSDAGGVKVNISSPDEARKMFTAIMDTCRKYDQAAVLEGVLMTRMAPAGVEMIVGATRDAQFGPVIMVGFGGIYVEILKDVALGLASLNKRTALNMIKSLKLAPMLQGARGQEALDIEALADILVQVSTLMQSVPEIMEIDLNPVRIYAKGVQALDARVIL